MAFIDDDGYQDWLEESDLEDSEEVRGWYDCPEDERAQYIEEHRDWWETF